MSAVTSSLVCYVELVFSKVGITDHFHFIIRGDNISASKPQTEGYLLTVKLFLTP